MSLKILFFFLKRKEVLIFKCDILYDLIKQLELTLFFYLTNIIYIRFLINLKYYSKLFLLRKKMLNSV